MNEHTVKAAAVLAWGIVLASFVWVAPRLLHQYNQRKLMEKAMFIPVEASYEERREQRGDYL